MMSNADMHDIFTEALIWIPIVGECIFRPISQQSLNIPVFFYVFTLLIRNM